MTAVIILLALSGLIGLVLGGSFSWLAILWSSVALAVLSAAVLQIGGFGAFSGIAIIATCLTVNQLAYLVGAFASHSSESLDQELRDRRDLPARDGSRLRPH
jgi:hypothetical protein